MTIMTFNGVSKTYKQGDSVVTALKHTDFEIKRGELVAITGPSGSGKSTFLSLAGALSTPTEGTILLNGTNLSSLNDKQLSTVRSKQIGFIFQSHHLLPYLKVKEQLTLVAKLAGQNAKYADDLAEELLGQLEIIHRINQYPDKLSGGEKQRVAIARALMNEPDIVLADEPTASLDHERARKAVEMISHQVKTRNKAAIMVTHDTRMLDLCDRIVTIEDGIFKEK